MSGLVCWWPPHVDLETERDQLRARVAELERENEQLRTANTEIATRLSAERDEAQADIEKLWSGTAEDLDRLRQRAEKAEAAAAAGLYAVRGFFDRIKHGDEKHQAWLRAECSKLEARVATDAGRAMLEKVERYEATLRAISEHNREEDGVQEFRDMADGALIGPEGWLGRAALEPK